MNLLILVGIAIFVVWAYILFIREWLVVRWPATFARWHAVEDALWSSSRTILLSRGYWVLGLVVGVHDLLAANGFDWTPILSQLGDLIPPAYRAPALSLFLILTGAIFEWLRRVTAAPGSMSAPGKAS